MIKDKIKRREELVEICRRLKAENKKIGFTSGVFDLIHAGHVEYLEKAKALCDVLIVGLNSDASTSAFKGAGRPIIPETQRALVLAALEPVDYVFVFDERRNKKNIELLQPDLYIKAGDYSTSQLTSKEIVEKVGGEVKLIPITIPVSTTDIISRITQNMAGALRVIEEEQATHLSYRPLKTGPAVILDRDGTINKEIEYLHEPEKFVFLPGALEGMKKMQDMGYRIVIVTTQAGIGLGYFTKEDFYRVNRKMLQEVAKKGITIDRIYFCPHGKQEMCPCRKPEPGLIRRAKEDLNLDLSKSYVIGDKTSDIEAGRRAGTRTILVRTGHAGQDGEFDVKPDFVADNLLQAADYILQTER